MAKRKFKVNILSADSIEQLKKDLIAYQNDLETKIKLLCKRLADEGAEIAQANVVSLDAVFTGELFNSISSEQVEAGKNRAVFVVKASSEHAIYVEFGTGIVGAENPYPGELPVVYGVGKHIRQFGNGRYGWFYQRDGQWYFTEGMPSRPFMYMAGLDLHKKVHKVAKEIFNV